MKALAIDTALEACSVALVDDGALVWSRREIIGRGHAEILPPMVAEALKASGLKGKDIDRIGVVIGPGAFAGVRVGLAFARSFRLGTGASVVGVASLQALAASVPSGRENYAIALDARRGQVYAAIYEGEKFAPRVEPFVATPQAAAARLEQALQAPMALTGSGAALVAAHLGRAAEILDVIHIDPAALARLAVDAVPSDAPPAPLYLRPPDATPSRPLFAERSDAS